MRINWFSNAPWASTGYGVQTRLITDRIQKAGHPTSITAFYGLQGARITAGEIPIYPAVNHIYGQDIIDPHARHFQADCIISLVDIWVINGRALSLPWFPWFPVDHEPMPRPVRKALDGTIKGIAMSKFGEKMTRNEGLDCWYIPHCVDTSVFKPLDMATCRKSLNLPQDAFIVGLVAANKGVPPRKAFYEQITAFVALKQKHPDAILYLHTDDGTHGGEVINIVQYLQRIGLKPGDVIFVDQYAYKLGLPDDYMVTMYNALDVLSLVSRGEGFGIPLIEAQACGVPVITGNWTSMGELCLSGWKLNKEDALPYYDENFDAFQWSPLPAAIAERYFAAYEMKGNQDYRLRARDGALAYDADKVFEKYWKPVLSDIQDIIDQRKDEPFVIRKVEL